MSSETTQNPILSANEVDSEEYDISPRTVEPQVPLHPAARAYAYVRSFYKAPALPPIKLLPDKAVGRFVAQGVPRPFGGSAEIDDRKGISQDGFKYMSKNHSARNLKKMTEAAILLLHRSRSREQNAQQHGYMKDGKPLPDGDEVYASLLKSKQSKPHENGVSTFAFAVARLISLSDRYLDLSALYGSTGLESDKIRIKDGRGMLSPDCFHDDRYATFPHAVSVLLILWNRNHNHIARRLMILNDQGTYFDPFYPTPGEDEATNLRILNQDNCIFEKAKLINCAQFRNVIMEDFLKGLFGIPLVGPSANFDVLADVAKSEKGKGYNPSIESVFLLQCSTVMLDAGPLSGSQAANGDTNFDPRPQRRHYAGLARGKDGRFNDIDLAGKLQDATEKVAEAPGYRATSFIRKSEESKLVDEGRRLNTYTLNDYRRYLGLKPYTSFPEWNKNSEIASAAEKLYGNIENLELYPGLQCEEICPGDGFQLGYTMTFGLLVDLVSRVRSDPNISRLTINELSQWGFDECQRAELDNGAFGGMMAKVLQRTLPSHYPFDNAYSLFPFVAPESLAPKELPKIETKRPANVVTHILTTKQAISYVFNRPSVYTTGYSRDLQALTGGYGYFLGFDHEKLHDQDQMLSMYALIPDVGALERYGQRFRVLMTDYLEEQSTKLDEDNNMSVDIAQVINATCTRWVCESLCDYSIEGESSFQKALEMHDKFGALYAFVFRNIEQDLGWKTKTSALKSAEMLRDHIKSKLPDAPDLQEEVDSWFNSERHLLGYLWGAVGDAWSTGRRIFDEFKGGQVLPSRTAQTFLKKLVNVNKTMPLDEDLHGHSELRHILKNTKLPLSDKDRLRLGQKRVVANVLGLASVTAIHLAQACIQAVEFYFDDKYTTERKHIIALASKNTLSNEDIALLMGYIREAQRIGQPFGLWREVKSNGVIPGTGMSVAKGDRIFADFYQAHMNANDFPDPETVDPHRRTPSIQGLGLHKCPGITFVERIMPEIFRAIFRLKNLQPAGGPNGGLKYFNVSIQPGVRKVFVNSKKETSYYPQSLEMKYQAEVDDQNKIKVSLSRRRKRHWNMKKLLHQAAVLRRQELANRAIYIFVIVVVLYIIYSAGIHLHFRFHTPKTTEVNATTNSTSSSLPATNTTASIPEKKPPVKACPSPDRFYPWAINSFIKGPDGKVPPLEYELDAPKRHKLSFIDIDANDVRFALYVDNNQVGGSQRPTNKSMHCGTDVRQCSKMGFNAGTYIVPPGKHTVRLEYDGDEFKEPKKDRIVDWGDEEERRFYLAKEYCGELEV